MAPKIIIQTTEKSSQNDHTLTKYSLFGWRSFRLGGILSQPLFAYLVLCTCNFIQNFTVNGANNAVISTLERVFYLNSVQSGLFLALYDVATVFSSPLVGYLGSRYSSPMFFALNMIIVGIGNMIIASSNFVHRDNTPNFNAEALPSASSANNVLFQCYKDPFNNFNMTDVVCLKQERLANTAANAKFLLYLGNFVNGIGSVALFTIGIAYIERIFPREKAAYCQGIYFAVGTIGGALGIVATGRFLLIYSKLTTRKKLPLWLTPNHPLWVGCWWLPYFVYGSLCLAIGLFVSGLPNYEKPGTKHLADRQAASRSAEREPNVSNRVLHREESATTISMISSCPSTPAPDNNPSKSLTNEPEDSLPALKPLAMEYRLSNRKFRQLSPMEHKKISNTLSTGDTPTEGIINHGFSDEALADRNTVTDGTLPVTPTPSMKADSTPESVEHTVRENFLHMCSVICDLLKNTRYVCIIVANLFEGILIKGFVPFITKYFEYQHQLDTSTATLLTGAIALLSVIIGCPLGACCMNKLAWTPMRCARVCGLVFTISSFLFLFLIFSCPELKFEFSPCSTENTACCHNIYRPVCAETGPRRMYLSPCHFGCTNQTTFATNGSNFYSSCNCAADDAVTVTEAACHFRRIPCSMIFALTVTGATFVVFFTAFIQVPMLQVLLYSVPFHYQSMALALRQTVVRVLGQTTGPLLFGFVFDQSCLVWLSDCNGRRTCKVYDNRRMGISMALSGFSTRIISGIACIIVFTNWKLWHSNEVIIPSNAVTPNTNHAIEKRDNGEKTEL